jgi:hypothetical protein
VYATERQADAEVIVGILHEIVDDDREEQDSEGFCKLCFNPIHKHSESCPFRMADEFIEKYGTQPPAGNWKRV